MNAMSQRKRGPFAVSQPDQPPPTRPSEIAAQQNMTEAQAELLPRKQTGVITIGGTPAETFHETHGPAPPRVEQALTTIKPEVTFREALTGRVSRAFDFAPSLRRNRKLVQMWELARQSVDFHKRAVKESQRRTVGIMGDLANKPRQFEIARRYIEMKDFEYTAQTDRPVPNGMTLPEIRDEIARLTPLVQKDRGIGAMLGRYTRMMQAIAQEKIAEGAPPDIIKNRWFYPHEVMDYMDYNRVGRRMARGARSLGKVNDPHMKRRAGSERAINNDFLNVITQYFERVERHRMNVEFLGRVKQFFNQPEEFGRPFNPKEPEMEFVKWIDKTGFFSPRAKNLPERIVERIQAGLATDPEIAKAIGVTPEQFQRMLGGDLTFGQLTLPRGVAETLDKMATYQTPKWETGLLADANRFFKSSALFLRTIPFFKNNLIGDTEHVILVDPYSMSPTNKAFHRAYRDEWNVFRGGPETPDGKLSIAKSVTDSGYVAKEVRSDVKQLPEFSRLQKRGVTVKDAKYVGGRMWDIFTLQGMHQARENFVRRANFYTNLDRIRSGKPIVNGPIDISGYKDPIDAAARVSREIVGDYGKFTPSEQVLRNALLVPFYSFFHNNTQFYARALAAPEYRGRAGVIGTKAVARYAYNKAKFLAIIGGIYGTVHAWNNSGDRKEIEDRLPSWRKSTTHIVLGRDKDGKAIIDSAQTTLDDFFRTIGLDGVSPDMWLAFQGKKSWTSVLNKWGEQGRMGGIPAVGHLYDAIIERTGPAIKEPMVMVGRDPFPNPRQARAIPREAIPKAMLKNFGLNVPVSFYEAGKGMSGKSVRQVAEETLSPTGRTHVNAEKENYVEVMNLAREFKRSRGYSGNEGIEYGPNTKYLAAVGRAAQDRGRLSEEKALEELNSQPTASYEGVRTYIRNKNPVYSLPIHMRDAFVESLTPEEKKQLDRAMEYWKQTFGSIGERR